MNKITTRPFAAISSTFLKIVVEMQPLLLPLLLFGVIKVPKKYFEYHFCLCAQKVFNSDSDNKLFSQSVLLSCSIGNHSTMMHTSHTTWYFHQWLVAGARCCLEYELCGFSAVLYCFLSCSWVVLCVAWGRRTSAVLWDWTWSSFQWFLSSFVTREWSCHLSWSSMDP